MTHQIAVGMERVNGKMADVIPPFGLEVAYTHQIYQLEHFMLAKKSRWPVSTPP
jgi:hypothetical protein